MMTTAISTGQKKGPGEFTDKVYSWLTSVLGETGEAVERAVMYHTKQAPADGMGPPGGKHLLGKSILGLCVSKCLS